MSLLAPSSPEILTRHGNDSAVDSDGDIRCPVHYISEPAHVALVHREGFSNILRQTIHAQTVTRRMANRVPAGTAGLAAGVTVRLVALPMVVI